MLCIVGLCLVPTLAGVGGAALSPVSLSTLGLVLSSMHCLVLHPTSHTLVVIIISLLSLVLVLVLVLVIVLVLVPSTTHSKNQAKGKNNV